MLEQYLEYNEEKNTWNLFVNGEWYLEGTYEQCSDAMAVNVACEYECNDAYEYEDCDCYDEEYEEDYEITSADLHDYMYGI